MNIYDIDIFEPIQSDLESYINDYTMAPELWAKFRIDDLPIVDYSKWKSIKLIDNGSFSQ